MKPALLGGASGKGDYFGISTRTNPHSKESNLHKYFLLRVRCGGMLLRTGLRAQVGRAQHAAPLQGSSLSVPLCLRRGKPKGQMKVILLQSPPAADFTTGAAALSGKAASPPTTCCTSSNVNPFVSGA